MFPDDPATSSDIWTGTFHSVCGRILRRFGEHVGYTSNFTIYDTDDQKRLIKDLIKANNFDDKIVPVKTVMNAISSAKDKLISPDDFAQNIGSDIIYAPGCEFFAVFLFVYSPTVDTKSCLVSLFDLLLG
mgnify:CR=1 FL=1